MRRRRKWQRAGAGGWFYYVLGVGLIGLAGVAHFRGASDTLVIVLVGAGLTLLPGSHAIEALRAWRGGGEIVPHGIEPGPDADA